MTTRPVFPPNRIIREGDVLICRDCGSGKFAHRQARYLERGDVDDAGPRADHRFNPPPFLERHPRLRVIRCWWRRLRDGGR